MATAAERNERTFCTSFWLEQMRSASEIRWALCGTRTRLELPIVLGSSDPGDPRPHAKHSVIDRSVQYSHDGRRVPEAGAKAVQDIDGKNAAEVRNLICRRPVTQSPGLAIKRAKTPGRRHSVAAWASGRSSRHRPEHKVSDT